MIKLWTCEGVLKSFVCEYASCLPVKRVFHKERTNLAPPAGRTLHIKYQTNINHAFTTIIMLWAVLAKVAMYVPRSVQMDHKTCLPSFFGQLLQVLLDISFWAVGVSAADEIRARSDDVLCCKLQPTKISDSEAPSSLARALCIASDSITYISLAAIAIDNSFATLPQDPLIAGVIYQREVTFCRASHCFNSAVFDISSLPHSLSPVV